MKSSIPAILVCAFVASKAYAAPSISSVSGAITDDQVVTINGADFGGGSPPSLWLGGASGWVDRQNDGVRIDSLGIPGISVLQPSTSMYPHVSTERSWSNGRSVVFDTRGTREYKQTIFLRVTGGYDTLYTNSMIYLQHADLAAGSYLQWKMFRWTRTETVVDGDGAYMANRPNRTSFFTNFSTQGQVTRWFNENGAVNLPGRGAWYRYETWVRLNSAPGVADGRFRVRATDPIRGTVVADNSYTNVVFNGSGDSGRFNYVVLQNYFGNAADSGSGQPDNANAVAWWDDIYVGTSEARVEVCSAPAWAQCVNREIQPAVTWADGSISVRLNKGAISALGGAYLYVTNARGEVNAQGFRLGAAATTPTTPPGFGVQ